MKDWQFENLFIRSKDVEAVFAYWMVLRLDKIPSDLSLGTIEFRERLSDHLAEADSRLFFRSQGHMESALYRALRRCQTANAWLLKQNILVPVASREIAEMLWKDACANERMRLGELQRPWWERLWDWLH